LIEELCDVQKPTCSKQQIDKSLSQISLEKISILEEVYGLKEKLYSSRQEPVTLISTISLRTVNACVGYEPVVLKSYEHSTEYEAPAEEKQP
jgi:hypothetical protein